MLPRMVSTLVSVATSASRVSDVRFEVFERHVLRSRFAGFRPL